MVKDAQRGVMDVVIELSRLDQRLADIGEWTPLPDPLPTNDFSVPETVAEHVVSTIKMIRNEYFREVISLLRSAAEQTDLALWLNFMQEEDQG
jgi:hypothetical protein